VETILVAYDGSEPARRAALRGGELAARAGASVTVLTVGELIESGYGTLVPVADREVFEGVVEEGAALTRSAGLEAATRLEWGHAADQIVAAARQVGATTIVMGHRGRGGLRDLLLGSVAKQVIDQAHCSVLVVR